MFFFLKGIFLVTYPVDQFGPDHYSWLIRHEIVPPIDVLGPISSQEIPERTSTVEQDLQRWNVIDSNLSVTDEASALFRGVYDYKFAYWGMLLLLNEKQPFQVEMDQELIDMGVAASLSDTPKVYWQVSWTGNHVTVAMRAGDVITINTTEPGNSLDTSIARGILSVLNPHNTWPAAVFTPVRIPIDPLSAIPSYDPAGKVLDSGTKTRLLRKELAKSGVEYDVIERYTKLVQVERLAETEVLFSPGVGQPSTKFFFIEFLHNVGMVLSRSATGIEGETVFIQEGATVDNVASAVKKLRS